MKEEWEKKKRKVGVGRQIFIGCNVFGVADISVGSRRFSCHEYYHAHVLHKTVWRFTYHEVENQLLRIIYCCFFSLLLLLSAHFLRGDLRSLSTVIVVSSSKKKEEIKKKKKISHKTSVLLLLFF